ncbi:DUF5381 family protein [Cytobacillus sp. FSL R5-0377]|uniref:DUF5381 family protein n=1 Tax=Cytobacillus sp. FSL R5-0377 TaxID=2954543 RepID=UPI0013FBC32E|nr:hypothetical protein KIS4809_4941 [Bacillus sp. ZZV12-4809]MCM3093757.1 YfjD family protein [Cytobacillus sp. AMY 15.2]
MFKIIPGEQGTNHSKKDTVSISSIRDINLVRNPFNLIIDIVIETFHDKKIKIRTYNFLGDLHYKLIVDQYIYPYMTENAKKVWDRKVNLERLRDVARYERKGTKFV